MSGVWAVRRLSRRTAIVGLGAGGVGAVLGGRALWARAAQDSTPVPITGLTFVGEASTPLSDEVLPFEGLPFVAVVVADAEPGGERRQARAYVCDGISINEWLDQGSVAGDAIDLSSASGATLRAVMTPEAVTGTVSLADGQSFSFEAALARGIAGLYNVTISEDGQIRGSSEAGGRIEGEVLAAAPVEDDLFPIVVTVTSPERDGNALEMRLEGLAPDMAGPSAERFVVLPDARMTGGPDDRSAGPKNFRMICMDF